MCTNIREKNEREPNKRDTEKMVVHVSLSKLGIFKSSDCIYERVLGLVGLIIFNQIFMEKHAPQNECFFRPIYDVY